MQVHSGCFGTRKRFRAGVNKLCIKFWDRIRFENKKKKKTNYAFPKKSPESRIVALLVFRFYTQQCVTACWKQREACALYGPPSEND